jgi:hypothetical protein
VTYDYYPEDRPRRQRSWLVAWPVAIFAVGAIAWTGFWYYASVTAQANIDGWRAREAQAGRTYTCGSQTLSGYPFRIEVECTEPDVTLAGNQPALRIRAKGIRVVSQVYDPTLLISEFSGPLTVGDLGREPTWTVNWALAQTSVRGKPSAPERVSIALDGPDFQQRSVNGAKVEIAKADHFEFHGRIVGGSANDHPLIEVVIRLGGAAAPALHQMAAEPIDGEIRAVLWGLKNLSPKPWPAELHDMQAAGGRLEIRQARLQQAGSIVVAAGMLTLTPQGRPDGELQLTVVGLDRLLAGLDIDRAASQLISQSDLNKIAPGLDANKLSQGLDRILPGLGNAVRKNSGAIAAAGVSALGQQTTLEGKPAVTLPLRFVDGVAFLGPLRVGETAPLF